MTPRPDSLCSLAAASAPGAAPAEGPGKWGRCHVFLVPRAWIFRGVGFIG